jgi:4'-phosphopantetheinyl transferase
LNGELIINEFRMGGACSFVLAPREIDLWRVDLNLPEPGYQEVERWLTDDERSRAGRFVFDRDRRRFVACRGRLRAILSRYLREEPCRLRFQYGPQGKPSLEPAPDPPLYFNVSHSHDLALIAVRRSGAVGVDVERLRPIEEAEAIARRYFTRREHATLSGLPAEERTAAFFCCWTRKEAMLKATGEGIGVSLDAVEVSLAPREPARVLGICGRPAEEVAAWRLYPAMPAAGYVGAVAAQGDEERLTGWEWTDAY